MSAETFHSDSRYRIESAIGDVAHRKRDIVPLYADLIASRDMRGGVGYFPEVNQAIIARWSRRALTDIKRAAWKLAERGRRVW